MELKEFVTQSLVQIVQGTEAAYEQLKETGAVINPGIHVNAVTDKMVRSTSGYSAVIPVEFDVALTIEENAKTEGGGKLNVVFSSIGGNAQSSITSSAVSRIKFAVPIQLPSR